jgi:hypothetical protein
MQYLQKKMADSSQLIHSLILATGPKLSLTVDPHGLNPILKPSEQIRVEK